MASVISGGNGTAKLRLFQYLKDLPYLQHPDGNTVKGIQLYATGSSNIFQYNYYNASLGENDVITNGDLGLLVTVTVKKFLEDAQFPIHNFWQQPFLYLFTRYAGDFSRLGLSKFWQEALTTGLRAPTNRPDEKFILFKIIGYGLDHNVAPYFFINPFPGTNIKTLLQLELENSTCTVINVPGLGRFNSVELFEPKRFKSLFITNQPQTTAFPKLTGKKLIKGSQFDIKPLVSGTVFGQNDDNNILSLFTSGYLSSGVLKFTAPRKDNMFLRLDNVQGQDLMFAAANQTILDKSIDPEEHNRPNITHLGPLLKASIEGQQLNYHLYKVSTTRNQLFLEAGGDGPFFINSDIGVKGIRPNSINDKVLNRPKYPNMALVAAHRGFWQEPGIPENTTLAFERSIALGADLMELDILKTHDGIYVLFHDNEVYRITDFTTRGIGVSHFNWDIPRANVQYQDENGIVKTVDLPPLKTLKLKDRFDNITTQRIQTLEEGLTYLKPKNVFVTLDKMDKFIDDIYVMVLKLGIEDNVLFKGAIVKDNQPDALEEKYGNIMQQINFTPVFFETTPDFVEVVEEFLRREREKGWTISALEPQMKTDADHLMPDPGGITKQQHNAMKNLINNYKGIKWIGMASITPWHCGDGFLRDHCAPKTGFKIGCANYDWRADPDFCIDYAQINYFITDRPRVIIDYLKVRGMH